MQIRVKRYAKPNSLSCVLFVLHLHNQFEMANSRDIEQEPRLTQETNNRNIPFQRHQDGKDMCCKGVLGYASDESVHGYLPSNGSSGYPCYGLRCCDPREEVAVVPIDDALGFRFECTVTFHITLPCYAPGSEVCTSNQNPDFRPRVCCEGSMFKVVLNQRHAATVIQCEAADDMT